MISIDGEEALDKVQQHFMIKTLNKIRIQGNLIKNICEKPTANIILYSETLDAYPLRLGTSKNVHYYHFCSTLHWRF